jgi:DNA polymerase I-like protein with 3'-5' exonuclease and polymerase domains
MRTPLVIDFETLPIGQRPAYPPRPVGVATKWPGQTSRYFAWGHPTANNCTLNDGLAELERAWDSGLPLLFHNSKFDVAVACEGLGAPMPPWDRIHDTLFLAYLCDPHARSLGLKELCEDLLEWAPQERDAVADWVMAHKDVLHQTYGARFGLKRPTPSKCGAWIGFCPGDVVAPYACGDVDRTAALFEHIYPLVLENGMGAAYDRERELMPILLENERVGMRADLERLEKDIATYGAAFAVAEDWLRQELRASGLNFDADADVAAVLLERGVVPADNWTTTKKSGKLATNKEALRPEHFTGPNGAAIASALGYRNRLTTCLNMFMRPWRDQAAINGGYITTNWNQVRNPADGGTRSGRPSTDKHNFLNLSKKWDGRDDGYVAPAFLGLPELPLVRRYVLPDKGQIFQHRDFDGQEMRVFAHGEQGELNRQFNEKPDLDPHAFVGDELMRVAQREIERTRVKTLNFQGLYGGGIPALQKKLRCSAAEAKELKAFHDKALPGRKILNEEIQRIVRRGLPIRTWGGRLYFVEAPRMVEGRMRNFEYKLINYYCQGSAADITKQALIDWNSIKGDSRFLVTVYDEINITSPLETKQREMNLLREAMEAPRLSVPMLSSGKEGMNWGDLTKCP